MQKHTHSVAATPSEMNARRELLNDAMRGRWHLVVKTYQECPVAQDMKITRTGETVLHLAVSNGDPDVVEKLLAKIEHAEAPRILGLRNDSGNLPLHLAAALGMERICRLIAERYPRHILEARNKERETPLFVAALHGRMNAFMALHSMSRSTDHRRPDLAHCKRKDGDTILHCAIAGEHFELAYRIMHLYEGLINVQNAKGETALHLLANKPLAFKSGSHLELFDRITYACIVIHPLQYDQDDDCKPSSTDHARLFDLPKRLLAKLSGNGSDKNNMQADSGRSSDPQTQPRESSSSMRALLPAASDQTARNRDQSSVALDEIVTVTDQGVDAGHLQERASSPYRFYEMYHGGDDGHSQGETDLTYGFNDQYHDGRFGRNEESQENAKLEEFTTQVGEQQRSTPRNSGDDARPRHSTSAQILENVAAWSVFLICALKIFLAILGIVGIGIWRTHIIRERKQKHKRAFQIMEELVERSTLWEYETMKKPLSQYGTKKDTPILIAAKKGVEEVVNKILDTFPVAMQDVDAEGKNVVLLAVENRQPAVYKLMLKRNILKDCVFGIVDAKGNSAVHLAATLGENHRPWAVPGSALQMQWEIKWYKFIERSMDRDVFVSFNKDGLTSKDIFSNSHKELIKEASKWLTNTSQSCSVVAALIAAVAFASISTVPGGTNDKNGTPVLEHEVAFEIFAISSLVALCSSVTSLVMFMSILTSRFEEGDFEKDLPRKLIMGLTFVFVSIAAVLVSFCSAHFFVVQRKLRYVAYPIYAVSCLPITLFAMAHFRLYIDLITATITHIPKRAYKNHSY